MANHVVLLQTALVQIAFGAAVKYAIERVAAVGLLVDLQMLLQVGARCKFLVAILALEWLLARVNPLVTD